MGCIKQLLIVDIHRRCQLHSNQLVLVSVGIFCGCPATLQTSFEEIVLYSTVSLYLFHMNLGSLCNISGFHPFHDLMYVFRICSAASSYDICTKRRYVLDLIYESLFVVIEHQSALCKLRVSRIRHY